MSNPTSVIDFDVTLATFLATAVSDGTWNDILDTLKFDEVGNEADASEVDGAGGQLWSNMVDDFIQEAYPTHYKATKVWRVADATALSALGSDDSLAVDDIGYTEDFNLFWYVVTVDGASASTWSHIVGKEVFVPSNQTAQRGDHSVDNVADAATGFMEVAIPLDFKVLLSIELLIIPTATNATANIDLATDFGVVGETFNNHSASDTTTTYNLTINQIFGIDLINVAILATPGDLMGVQLTNSSGASLDMIGIRLRYL